MTDLPFDIIELAPCPASVEAMPDAPLPEVAFRENAWLPEEIAELRRRFAADEALAAIATSLDRGLHGVRSKIWELGLRRNSSRPWLDLDDGELGRSYGTVATSTIAGLLGRSVAATYARARFLGLSEAAAPPYTAWELAQIRAGFAAGVKVTQLAVLIGRPTSGIATIAWRLGIRHANGPVGWSDAEQARALALAETGIRYPALSERLVAEGFRPREPGAVGQMLRHLGYGRGWGRPWLAEEDDLIRAAYGDGGSLAPLQERLGRTRSSIAYRAGELGLQGTHARPNGWRTDPPWTDEEIAILRRDYGRLDTDELARSLGRKKSGVYNKAHSLRLQHGYLRAFSDDEERAIRIARDAGISLTDLSAALNRDLAVVSKHAIRMGIPFATRTTPSPRGRRAGRPAMTLAAILAMNASGSATGSASPASTTNSTTP